MVFNEEAAAKVLLRDDIKDLPVAVLSVAGALRKGKSFFLTLCLRYLNHGDANGDWLDPQGDSLTGFQWKGGSVSVTKGISFWSHVFTATTSEGKKVAVVLVDTEGVFDVGSTMAENVNIFTLSTLISSVQVYNISQMIQQDHLQHLLMFSEYSQQVRNETGSEMPFQKLVFLIRDWTSPHEHPYGWKGGKQHLEKWLSKQVGSSQNEELRHSRERIVSSFSSLDCFLMPHPGLTVAIGNSFRGRLEDVNHDFLVRAKEIIPGLLSPDNLVVKTIGGEPFTCEMLFKHIRTIVKCLSSKNFPEPSAMLDTAAEAGWLKAEKMALDDYIIRINTVIKWKGDFLPASHLQNEHEEIKKRILLETEEKPLLNKKKFLEPMLKSISEGIDTRYADVKHMNQLRASTYCRKAEEDIEATYRQKISETCNTTVKFTATRRIEHEHNLMKSQLLEDVKKRQVLQDSEYLDPLVEKINQRLESLFLEATHLNQNIANEFCHKVAEDSKSQYENLMRKIPGSIVHPKELEQKHQESRKSVLNTIADIPVLPTTEFYERLREGVEKEIDARYQERRTRNERDREAKFKQVFTNAVETYNNRMKELSGDLEFASSHTLEKNHETSRSFVFAELSKIPSLSKAGLLDPLQSELKPKIEEVFEKLAWNNMKQAETYCEKAAAEVLDAYEIAIRKVCRRMEKYVPPCKLDRKHHEFVDTIVRALGARPVLRDTEFLKPLLRRVQQDISEIYTDISKENAKRKKAADSWTVSKIGMVIVNIFKENVNFSTWYKNFRGNRGIEEAMAVDIELGDGNQVQLKRSHSTASTSSTNEVVVSDTLKRINAVLGLENIADHTVEEISQAINRLTSVLDETDHTVSENHRTAEIKRVARVLEFENPDKVTAGEIVEKLGSLFAVFG